MAAFDSRAKKALAEWPQVTNQLWPASRPRGAWLRAQPLDGISAGPRLKTAGSDSFKTQPDGLWAFISKDDEFADCIAIEACGSAQNFADKRSRYQPSTCATVLICPAKWLRGVPRRSGNKKRWQHACGFEEEPSRDLTLPTRFVRVLYFLKDDLYAKFRGTGVPGAHEYVASYSSIRSYSSQQMQTFLRRMSTEQHFYKRAVRAT